jgi:hypothetical protein
VNWTTIVSVVGGSAAFFAAAAWLARSLVQHLLSKEIERFKADLQAQHQIALERAKSDFQRLLREHEIRFSHLHAKRAEIVAELYQHIVETNSAAEECLDAFKESPNKRRFDLAKEATSRGDDLAEFIIRNKIYFSERLAGCLEEVYSCLLDTAICYRMHCDALLRNEDTTAYEGMLHEVQTDTGGALRGSAPVTVKR